METSRLGVEDHSRLLRQVNLHEGLIACCLEVSGGSSLSFSPVLCHRKTYFSPVFG